MSEGLSRQDIEQLATLTATVKQLAERVTELGSTMQDLSARINRLPTADQITSRIEHSNLADRVGRLEDLVRVSVESLDAKIKAQSLMSLWEKLTRITVGIASLAAAVGVLAIFFKK